MYNGIGLATARGSGTNGYVVKNNASFRVGGPRGGPAGKPGTGSNAWGDDLLEPPRHRQPDQGILEHERKREVEVRCVELADELEEKGVPEDEILEEVSALRKKLLLNLPKPRNAKHLKSSDSHGIAAAKEAEMNRMGRALGMSSSYKEGGAFDREEQERIRLQKRAEWEERNQAKLDREEMLMIEAEKAKEAEKVARREAERRRIAAEREAKRNPPPPKDISPPRRQQRSPSPPPKRGRQDSFSPPPRRRDVSRSPSPPRGIAIKGSGAVSIKGKAKLESTVPPPQISVRGQGTTRDVSPPPRRRDDDSPPLQARRRRDVSDEEGSPVRRGRRGSSTPPSKRRRRYSDESDDASRSRSPPPGRGARDRSDTPPRERR